MKFKVYNIGGIVNPLEVEISKGVSVYKAPNAYGKTSIARALLSLLTSSIKPDELLNVFADNGYIELEYEGKSYYRRIKRIRNKLLESSKLYMDDDRALLLSYFSPENKLLNQVLGGQENVEWFISSTSKIDEIKKKKEEVETKLSSLQKEREELNDKYKQALDLKAKMRNIDDEIARLEKEKESDKILNKTTHAITTTRQNKLNEIIDKINAKRNELNEIQTRLTKLELEIQQKESMIKPEIIKSFQDQIAQIDEELQRKSSLRNDTEIEIRLLERVLDEIKESEKKKLSTCYVCGSHVDPDAWKVRSDIISKELREKMASFDSIKKESEELSKKKDELSRRIKEIEALQNDVAKLRTSRQDLIDKIEAIKTQIENYERQKREMEDRFSRSSDMLRVVEVEDEPTRRIHELQKKRGELEYELSLLGVPNALLEKLSEKEKEIEDLQKLSEDLKKEYIRRLTIAREEFMKISNQLLSQLEFDLEAEINDNYQLVVKRNGATLDLKKLSSSERTTLALILVITGLKSYFKTPFFIVDESFMTFDQKRFDRLVNYLADVTDYIIITKSDENVEFVKETMEPQVSS
ncbi:archaea-specific SMC-related protein [Acidianus brierleyi]|uniref:Zinc-hook domain-containing protein n=1 Tax=Acidianus brierleyi TaxID=41673 RepID=A0A2U9IBQ8_9CREN|nr:archaea-specific SMC-related protein [Acidianus brierleyi]AWR93445.1 hypothetical protein DFR85_01300 [Acidianus brierleyi]